MTEMVEAPPRMSRAGAQERVARGAALLDDREPGWLRWVNLASLDVQSGSYCPLAQATRLEYNVAMERLGLGLEVAVEYGFNGNLKSGRAYWDECVLLTEAWRDLIRARRARE